MKSIEWFRLRREGYRSWRTTSNEPHNPLVAAGDYMAEKGFKLVKVPMLNGMVAINGDHAAIATISFINRVAEMQSLIMAFKGAIDPENGLTEGTLASTRWNKGRKKQVYAWSLRTRANQLREEIEAKGGNPQDNDTLRAMEAVIKDVLGEDLQPLTTEDVISLTRNTVELELETDGTGF